MIVIQAACLGRDVGEPDADRGRLDQVDSDAPVIPPPPGGLVDTQPSSGWTEGTLSVSEDGAASYNIPLWVPDGRGGLTPDLGLHYSSRGGDGPLGVGWSLSGLSAIEPCPRTIAQDGRRQGISFSDADVYCLDGTRLRHVGGLPNGDIEYRTEQNPFARIVSHSSNGNIDHFTIQTKDGRTLTYGGVHNATLDQTRLVGVDRENPRLDAQLQLARTRWSLRRIEDRNGNRMDFEYERRHMDDDHAFELLPRRIRYEPGRVIEFEYEDRDHHVDGFTAGGAEGSVRHRLSRHLVAIRAMGPTLLREYRLSYDTGRTGRSRLASVTECDASGVCLLPVEFAWTDASLEFEPIETDITDVGGFGVSGFTFDTGDVNGDGKDDLLYGDVNNEWRIRLSNGVDGFGPAQEAGIPRARDRLYRPRLHTIDYDRDGLLDVLAEVNAGDASQPDGTKLALFRSVGGSFQRVTPDLDDMRLGDLEDLDGAYAGYFADLDGNGLTDYVSPAFEGTSSLRWRYAPNPFTDSGMQTTDVLLNYGEEGPTPIRVLDPDGDGRNELIARQPASSSYVRVREGIDGLTFSAEGMNLPFDRTPENGDPANLHFADVNGDGLEDAVYPFSGLGVQLNSGSGFSAIIPGPADYKDPDLPPPSDRQHRGVRFLDIDGDGADDVLVFHKGSPASETDHTQGMQLYVWRSGSFVRIAEAARAMPVLYSHDGIQPLDYDGDGLIDIAYMVAEDGSTPKHLQILRHKGAVPDRLIGVSVQSLGPRAEIDYTTLADRAVHQPGSCDYPLVCGRRGGSVVSAHRLANGVDDMNPWREYRHSYREARTSVTGRGWLGFAEHTVVDGETGASRTSAFDNATGESVPGQEAPLLIHPLAHRPSSVTTTVTTEDGRTYTRIITSTRRVRPGPTLATYSVELGYVLDMDVETGEGGGILHVRSGEYDYDDLGNLTDSITISGGLKLTTRLDYLNDLTTWRVGLLQDRRSTSCDTATDDCTSRRTKYDYDETGNLELIVVEPDHDDFYLRTDLVRGSFGNISSATVTDALGEARATSFTYDAQALYPRTTTNALGHVQTTDFHPGLGVLLSTTDANDIILATMKYDRLGRLREVNHADGSFQHFASFGPLTWFTVVPDGLGGTTTAEVVTWDKLGRTTETSTPLFSGGLSTARIAYDRRGDLVSITRPFESDAPGPFHTTQLRYDARGRLLSVREPDGVSTTHEYRGLETHTYDGRDNHSYVVERPDGRVESRYEDDPDSDGWLRTQFKYGPFGLVREIVAPDQTSQVIGHDLRGRRTSLVDPSAGTTLTSYTAFGEVESETDANGTIVDYQYDLLGRLQTITSPDGQATYKWDTAPNGKGKPVNFKSADGVGINYRYDPIGRPKTTGWNIEGTSYELSYDYDEIGRLGELTYPTIPGTAERLRLRYRYKPNGFLERISDGAGGDIHYWTAEARDPAGALLRERFGNHIITEYGYQPETGLLTSIAATAPAQIPLSNLQYAYDGARNVTSRGDLVNGRSETYFHDELDRLVTWTATNGVTNLIATYDYDLAGNLQSEIVTGVAGQSATYGYGENGAPPHAVTSRNSAEYTYDDAGRQVAGPNRTVQYNVLGLPKSLTWGIDQGPTKVTHFAYDANGSRVVKRDQDQTVLYVGGLFERRAPAGTGGTEIHNIHNIVADGRTVAQVVWAQPSGGATITPRTYYLHGDAQGSTTFVTNAAGEVVTDDAFLGTLAIDLGHLYYDPWGRRIDATFKPLGRNRHGGPRQGYTGHEHEDEVGLINMQGRIYDPQSRRFLTPDPFVPDPLSGQSYNRYSYVGNNPTTFIDPTGFYEEEPPKHREPTEIPEPLTPNPDMMPEPPKSEPPGIDVVFPPASPPPSGPSPHYPWGGFGHPGQGGGGQPGGGKQTSDDNSETDWSGADTVRFPNSSSEHEQDGTVIFDFDFDDDPSDNGLVPLFDGSPWGILPPILVERDTRLAYEGAMILATAVSGLWGAVRGLASAAGGLISRGVRAVRGVRGLPAARGAAPSSSRVLGFTRRNLQKGFDKHGADFGLTGNWNSSRAAEFSRAVNQHINNPSVRPITGTYLGRSVTHYLNPNTGLNVIADRAGNYVSGWKLGPEQLKSVLSTGRLF